MSGVTNVATQQASVSTWDPEVVKRSIDQACDQIQQTSIAVGRVIAAPIVQLASGPALDQLKQYSTEENCGSAAPLMRAVADIAKGPIGACITANAPQIVESSIKTVVPLAKEVAYKAVDSSDHCIKFFK